MVPIINLVELVRKWRRETLEAEKKAAEEFAQRLRNGETITYPYDQDGRHGLSKWAAAKELVGCIFDASRRPECLAEPMAGHGEECHYCRKPCSSLAGDLDQWPIALCRGGDLGPPKWHHAGCIGKRLGMAEAAMGMREALLHIQAEAEMGTWPTGFPVSHGPERRLETIAMLCREGLSGGQTDSGRDT
jgi:hypothetical protein